MLVYHGLNPPILFAHGDPRELRELFEQLEPGRYWYTLRPTEVEALARLDSQSRTKMWRMRLVNSTSPPITGQVLALSERDLPAVEDLFGEHPDRPDAFTAEQLDQGVYYGALEDDKLVSVAGTHVVCQETSVGALGNVFTHPAYRSHGFGSSVVSAVLDELLDAAVETIVLNVAIENQTAAELYQKLGFMPYCGFYEGIGTII